MESKRLRLFWSVGNGAGLESEEQCNKALSIKQNMLWNSAGSLVSLGCQWIVTVLVARLANGFDSAGVYSLAMSVYGIFTPLAQYRLYTYQVSDVKGEYRIGEYFSFRLISTATALISTLIYSLFTCRLSAIPSIILYGLYKSAGLVIDVFHGADQLRGRMDYIGKSLAAQGVLSLGAFVAIFKITGCLELALIGMILATCLVGLLFDFPRTSNLESLVIQFNYKKMRHLAACCAPLVLAGIACSAASSIPRQYVSIVFGNAALGAYASMAAPVSVIQMGVCYIYNPLLSYLAESYIEGDRKRFIHLFRLVLLGAALVSTFCAVFISVFGGPLMVLVFGNSISDYLYLLMPLVVLAALTGLMWFINDLLIAVRSFKATLVGGLLSLVVSLAATIPAISSFGLNGITVASSLACLVGVIYMLLALLRISTSHFMA